MTLPVRIVASSIALAGLLSAACMSMTPAAEVPSLDGTAWVLSSLPDHTLVPGSPATLRFEGGRASGSDSCNRYATSYTASRGQLKFDAAAAATMMACAPAIMEQARAFTASLGATSSYRIANGQLQLLAPAGTVVASFTPQSQELAGTSWHVTGYNNGKQAVVSVLPGTQLTAEFAADGRVSGSAGCNNYTATYTASGSSLRFGPAATTRKMCAQPDGIMEQEQQFLKALETVTTIRQEGERAELRTADGALAVSLGKGAAE
jgi:heat shock protein HslJ